MAFEFEVFYGKAKIVPTSGTFQSLSGFFLKFECKM